LKGQRFFLSFQRMAEDDRAKLAPMAFIDADDLPALDDRTSE